MRILSLLPSATEIVYALGLEESLVGVTAECDFPAGASDKPAVSFPAIGTTADAAAVDGVVSSLMASGEPLYRLDEPRIALLAPDLILAQDLCRVCAVPSGDVTAALGRLGCHAAVLSLDPETLDEVLAGITAVADAAGAGPRGRVLVASLRARLDAVRRATVGRRPPRVLELEWADPAYVGGHWVPDMVEAAGGGALLSRSGLASARLSWPEIAGSGAEVVVVAPCGYGLARAVTEAEAILRRPELDGLGALWAVDGSAYFSRPGPRVVDGVELLAGILHPGLLPAPSPDRARRLR